MTVEPAPVTEQKPNDKELNFRALEAKFQRQLEQERAEKLEAQRVARELMEKTQKFEEEDEAEPYVGHKNLEKKLARVAEQTKQYTKSEIQENIKHALQEERQKAWLESNPDFYDVLQNNAERFMKQAPHLADTILKMPDDFERKKLVYYNIKSLGIDKPEVKQPSVQEKIDANKRSAFYQPPTMGTAPYAAAGDFSPSGMKSSYDKMKELQARLRI